MTNFLFWNTDGKALDALVARLVEEHAVDVLLLVERDHPPATLLAKLNEFASFHVIVSHRRFHLLTRFGPRLIRRLVPIDRNDRSDYWHLKLPAQVDVLLVGVHGFDMRNRGPDQQEMLFARIAANIRLLEKTKTRHQRTIVVGDFNANPFDPAMISLRGLHAIQLPQVAGKSSRRYGDQEHDFFYNPMWNRLGAGDDSPPATYYYYRYRPHEIFWYMLDQVIIRPEALPLFPEADLKIIDTVAGSSLLKPNGTPDRDAGSDHLPLFFRLNLKKVAPHG